MAKVDVYTKEAQRAVYTSALVNGGQLVAISTKIEGGTGDSADSVYRFAKDIDSNLIPFKLWISTPAIADGTAKIGIYKPNGGAAVDDDALDSAIDLATEKKNIDGLTAITTGNQQKTLAELANIEAADYPAVDLGFKISGAAAAGKVIDVTGIFLKP